MTRPFSRPEPLLALVVFVALACHDETQPVSSIAAPTKVNASIAIDEYEDTWNYYSADVTVTRFAGQNTAQVSHGTTYSSFGIVRTLSGDMWASNISEDPLASPGFGGPIPPEMDIGRLQTNDAGHYLYAYTRNGTPLSITPSLMTNEYAIMDPPPGHDPLPPLPTPPPGASASVGVGAGPVSPAMDLRLRTSAGAGTPRDPRAWLANVVSTPKNRVKMAAARLRHLGPPVGRIRALERYVLKSQGRDFEELVDPETGVTLERNVSVNGRLIVRQTRSYVNAGGDRFALTKIRIENAAAGAEGSPAVTEITFDNVRIEARAN